MSSLADTVAQRVSFPKVRVPSSEALKSSVVRLNPGAAAATIGSAIRSRRKRGTLRAGLARSFAADASVGAIRCAAAHPHTSTLGCSSSGLGRLLEAGVVSNPNDKKSYEMIRNRWCFLKIQISVTYNA